MSIISKSKLWRYDNEGIDEISRNTNQLYGYLHICGKVLTDHCECLLQLVLNSLAIDGDEYLQLLKECYEGFSKVQQQD